MSSNCKDELKALMLYSATARELKYKYENLSRYLLFLLDSYIFRPFYMLFDTLLGVLLLYYFIEYNVFGYLPAFTTKTVSTFDHVICFRTQKSTALF